MRVREQQAPNRPFLNHPSRSVRARCLHLGRVGSLSTLSRKRPGFPFGSLMPYALDGAGRPVFLISTMAMHTQNLQQDGRASLLVTQPEASGDPLGAARVTLVGNVSLVAAAEVGEARRLYLERHENSKYWVDFDDFSFFAMDVVDVYYVGGFGVMGWITAQEYIQAQPDPLADAAAGILQHMNADHQDALILLARVFAGMEAQEAVMTSVDRLGFHVRMKTEEGMKGARVAFPSEVSTPRRNQEDAGGNGAAGASLVTTLYRPDLLYSQPAFTRGPGLLVESNWECLSCRYERLRCRCRSARESAVSWLCQCSFSFLSAPDPRQVGVQGDQRPRLLVMARDDVPCRRKA